MCGIVGYIGSKSAANVIVSGLRSLEYRGYDSAGIALQNSSGNISVFKETGSVENLEKKLSNVCMLNQQCGIGHTRWATHGEANEQNAHPHYSDDMSVAIVHNGIIENHAELKSKLQKIGYSFYSSTDTEILAKLIHYYLGKYKKPMDALARVCLRATGSFAVCILFECSPNTIYCIKKDSPLVVGKGTNGVYIASDALALSQHAREVVYINNMEIVCANANDFNIYTIDQEIKEKKFERIEQGLGGSQKNGYSHFMLKEIYEQPDVLKRVICHYSNGGRLKNIPINCKDICSNQQINIVACGSAFNAALAGAKMIEDIAGIQTKVHLASEWRYETDCSRKSDLFVFVSQSGETADTISCLRKAKNLGHKTISIVNVFGSTLWRESDVVLPVLAGTEVAVATTKAYTAQILVFHFLALKIAKCNGILTNCKLKSCIFKLRKIPKLIKNYLSSSQNIQKLAQTCYTKNSVFFLGRLSDYNICKEANLKFKEISYIHSEEYAAGELKHGSISLVENGTLVVGVVCDEAVSEKTISNLAEVKTRGALVVVFSSLPKGRFSLVADEFVSIPKCSKNLQPIVSIVPLQLFSYYVALARGCNIDKPRNLAKSVTVE